MVQDWYTCCTVATIQERKTSDGQAHCAESSDPRLRLLVLVALHTGARQTELLNLRWSDVDLEAG